MFGKRVLLITLLFVVAVTPSFAQDATVITWLKSWVGAVPRKLSRHSKQRTLISMWNWNKCPSPCSSRFKFGWRQAVRTPDVISVDVPLVAGYGLRGWLLPLDESVRAG